MTTTDPSVVRLADTLLIAGFKREEDWFLLNEGEDFMEQIHIDTLAKLSEALGYSQPVAKIVRNEAGQISMQAPEGGPFDMSLFVGRALYASPQRAEPASVQAPPLSVQFSADYLRAYMEGEPAEARRHLDKLLAAIAAHPSTAP